MSMTVQEFKDAIEDDNILYRNYDGVVESAEIEDEGEEYLWSELHGESGETRYAVKDVGPIVVHDSTGGMDEGSNASIVFSVGGTYFRKSGYYASHYGYDWDGRLEEVVPAEKTITVYKSVR